MNGLIYRPSIHDTAAYVNQVTVPDFRALPYRYRKWLSRGPTIDIYVGENPVFCWMPKRVFMAFSTWAQHVLTVHPFAQAFSFSPDQVTEFAVFRLCAFMYGNCRRRFGLRPVQDIGTTIDCYRLAHFLGLYRYIGGLTNHICGLLVRGYIPALRELNVIATLPPGDRVYRLTVAIFSSLRYRGNIGNVDMFQEWLSIHPDFEAGMLRYSAMKERQKAERWEQQIAHTRAQQGIVNLPESHHPATGNGQTLV